MEWGLRTGRRTAGWERENERKGDEGTSLILSNGMLVKGI
jgi:hypothetical protein